MHIDVASGRGRITIGPPGGPTETIPAAVTVTITDTLPYDVEARLEWSPTVGRLAVRKVCCTAVPGAEDVSPAGIARIALRDTIQIALETEYLGALGWSGLVERHRDRDQLAVDALVYLLALALQSPKPTSTVATRTRSVSRQRTQAGARRSESRTAATDRTRQARRRLITGRELQAGHRRIGSRSMAQTSGPPPAIRH